MYTLLQAYFILSPYINAVCNFRLAILPSLPQGVLLQQVDEIIRQSFIASPAL